MDEMNHGTEDGDRNHVIIVINFEMENAKLAMRLKFSLLRCYNQNKATVSPSPTVRATRLCVKIIM